MAEMDAEANIKQLQKTSNLFDKSLRALMEGDPELRLRPVKSAMVKSSLQDIEFSLGYLFIFRHLAQDNMLSAYSQAV